ncbi:MAG: hypothetical protein H7A42_03075 [Chlamydiales bacterium]|nr:hypothetical protein [Chlamydiales bacterium]
MKKQFSIITLILSTSTWICCVLPILITIIAGAGAVSTLASIFPCSTPISLYVIASFPINYAAIKIR